MQQEITQIVFAYTDFIMLQMQIRPKQFVDKRYTHFDMNENEQFYSFFSNTLTDSYQIWSSLSTYSRFLVFATADSYILGDRHLMGELCPGVCITPKASLYDTFATNIEHLFNLIPTRSLIKLIS